MSLYNQIFGYNQFISLILASLGLALEDPREDLRNIGRFRDAYITDDNKFAILTRLGGANREPHQENIAFLRGLPGYISDKDDDWDNTYATFYYEPAPAFLGITERAREVQGHYDPMERFAQMIKDMEAGNTTPDTERGYEVGKPIIDGIVSAIKDGETAIDVFDADRRS